MSVPDRVARREALRDLVREHEADALLVTDLLNLRYLTGFTGSSGSLLLSAHDTAADESRTVVCTDGRYITQIAEQVPDLVAVIDRAGPVRLLRDAAERSNSASTVGFESHVVSVDDHQRWTDEASSLRLSRLPRLVEKLREVKDESEIAALRTACGVADSALAALIERGGISAGRTEKQVAIDLEFLMLEHGAHAISFETIVATGANSAVPHHRPTGAVLEQGDLVKFDFGAAVDGYHSDMTRTYVLGRPAEWQRDLYELVARAQAAGRAAVKPGAQVRDVDGAARSVIVDAGHGDRFLHGLGHGVGLEIHEAPGIGATGTGTLLRGAAVTVEPGVYFSGRGGVRIEDTLVVREDESELLTLTSKEFTEL
ncbi:MAG: Xaa-Pro peptidase family protein [Rhodococcus sp. (in: high G+C Gram-positive bacteria)]